MFIYLMDFINVFPIRAFIVNVATNCIKGFILKVQDVPANAATGRTNSIVPSAIDLLSEFFEKYPFDKKYKPWDPSVDTVVNRGLISKRLHARAVVIEGRQ